MPRKKIECPVCGGLMGATSELCRKCKPTYQRTVEHRATMSRALTGKPRPSMQGKKRPEVGAKIREWWTPERREAKRQEMMGRNPDARYHGLSCKGARRLRSAVGSCETCGHDGSESRLDVHHRNGDKRDQGLANLIVLCHRCHMNLHSEQGDLVRQSKRPCS